MAARNKTLLFTMCMQFLMCWAIAPASAQKIIAQIPIPSNSCCSVTVNPALNLVYTSGGYSGGQTVTSIDGQALSVITSVFGSGAAVDTKTDNYWAAGVYSGSAMVYSGSTNSEIRNVPLGGCPGQVAFDCKVRRVWAAAQCGGGNDPLYAVNADTFAVVAGPIGSGGVQGPIIANPSSGALFIAPGGVSKRVDGKTFAVTNNGFGQVVAVDSVLDKLYAISGTNLQIVNGKTNPEAILKTVALGYAPGGSGAVNNALDHLYLENPAGDSIDIRNDATGKLITTVPLGTGNSPLAMAADSTRGRLYVTVGNNGSISLFVIDDSSTARVCLSRGSC